MLLLEPDQDKVFLRQWFSYHSGNGQGKDFLNLNLSFGF